MSKFGRGFQKRKIDNRIQREKFLIVCEGERTEPNYFEALKDMLPKGVLYLRIEGIGYNTVSLVKEAIRLQEEDSKNGVEYDHIWVVFDKDDFSDEQFNNAIDLAEKNKIKTAYSNQAFELWYLLHFDYIDSSLHRGRYIEMLSKRFGNEYQKKDPNIYARLQELGDENRAIANARKLYNNYDHSSPATENPSTTVHHLVVLLNRFRESQ